MRHSPRVKDDFRDRSHLTAVEGDIPHDAPAVPWRRQSLAESEQVTCWQCKKDIGIATSAVIEVTVAPRRTPRNTKAGGTKQWACAHCLARGKVTKLIG